MSTEMVTNIANAVAGFMDALQRAENLEDIQAYARKCQMDILDVLDVSEPEPVITEWTLPPESMFVSPERASAAAAAIVGVLAYSKGPMTRTQVGRGLKMYSANECNAGIDHLVKSGEGTATVHRTPGAPGRPLTLIDLVPQSVIAERILSRYPEGKREEMRRFLFR